MATYQAAPVITQLGGEFYDPVSPADFPKADLRYRNQRAAQTIGLENLSKAQWLDHFSSFKPLPDNLMRPLALRYHGHQFRVYNPDIGDGRGFLFAQVRDDQGRLLDLGTKGSGQTPYSRAGDGRLTLLGGVREVLATSYLEYLGVNTSKSFSLVETGEELTRHDEPSPTRSAVLVRLSHSHIRFGTFQRLAYLGETDNMQDLADYCRKYYYEDAQNTAELFSAIIKSNADMVASWMAAGFVHGVMNTDNMNITGESFDYGPYRFLPTLQSAFTAAYFDHQKLYAFARQPEIIAWNLGQLASSLSLIVDDKALISALDAYAPQYQGRFIHHVFRRLAVQPKDFEKSHAFIRETYLWLEESQCPWPQFWFDWQGGAQAKTRALQGPNKAFYQGESFKDWFKALSQFEPAADFKAPDRDSPPSLLYGEIGALWRPIAETDNWSEFDKKIKSFQGG